MRTLFKLLSWALKLGIVAALLWWLAPLYRHYPASRPLASSDDDTIVWTLHGSDNRDVFQRLTIHRDGRSQLLISRVPGDPDIPPTLAGWQISRDPNRKTHHFVKPQPISAAAAQQLFNDALAAGLLDLRQEPTAVRVAMGISYTFGSQSAELRGPARLANPWHWQPQRWVSRQRWRQLAERLRRDPDLWAQLIKTEVTLVSDEEMHRIEEAEANGSQDW